MLRSAGGFAGILLLLLSPVFSQRKGAAPAATKSAPPSVTSTSRIVVTYGDLHGETFTLPKFNGDWFVTPTDANAVLNLSSVPPNHAISIHLQWGGKQPTTVLTSDLGVARISFFLQMSGQHPYDFSAQLDRADALTVTVLRMEDRDLEVRIDGVASKLGDTQRTPGRMPVQISGNILLHRDSAPAPLLTGPYLNCDNVIHDKLVGAESRSPSECEVKFDAVVRRLMEDAFNRVLSSLTAANWILEQPPAPGPITDVARHTEGSPYRLESAHQGGYHFTLRLNPSSEPYQRYQAQMQQAMQKAAAGGSVEELGRAAREMQGATLITVSAMINESSTAFVNFKAEHTLLQIPGAAWAVSAPFVQSPSGGDIGGSQEVAYVFLGPWGAPTIEKLGDGGERIGIAASVDKAAPLLAVQNIRIRIQANAALREAIVKQIDWTVLRALLIASHK